MRIMVLEPAPDYGGGCEQFSLMLSQYLAGQGHTLFLLHESDGSMLPAYESLVAGRFQIPLPGFARRRPFRTLTSILRIGRLARDHDIDVVVSSHLGFIPVAACVSAIFGTRFCFHLGLPCSSSRARFAYPRIAAGVAPSEHCAENWRDGGWPPARMRVIPNWVDTDRFRPAGDLRKARLDLDLPPDAEIIAYVGRICPEKGIGDLIEAFGKIADGRPNAHLMFVGRMEAAYEGEFQERLACLDASARQRIIIRPITDTPEKYFAAATIACMPSLVDETFGLALIEAMASGIPVIVSRIKAFAEILGGDHADMFVSPGDSSALAERLRWWLDNPAARAERGRALREKCLETFTAAKCGARYEALLVSVAETVPSARILPVREMS